MSEGLNVAVVVCQPPHIRFDRTVGAVRIVNAGSAGMPFGGSRATWLLPPGPDFGIITATPPKLTKAAALVRGAVYPRARDFAADNILQPPSKARMPEFIRPGP